MIILMKIVCFILSYKIIKLGYNLISSGVKGEFKFSSNFIGFKSDLTSLSPGLLFVLLGVVLMMVAIYINKTATIETGSRPSTNGKQTKQGYSDSAVMPGLNDFLKTDSANKKN